jgi:hypothetical protein
VGINQVVDRHQVETGIEFLEEKIFDKRQVQQTEKQQVHQAAQHGFHPAPGRPPGRKQKQQRRQRPQHKRQNQTIVPDPQGQHRRKIQRRHPFFPTEPPPQYHPQQQRKPEINGTQQYQRPQSWAYRKIFTGNFHKFFSHNISR